MFYNLSEFWKVPYIYDLINDLVNVEENDTSLFKSEIAGGWICGIWFDQIFLEKDEKLYDLFQLFTVHLLLLSDRHFESCTSMSLSGHIPQKSQDYHLLYHTSLGSV